jgi:5-methylcytosine-specific restriction endonuclease McrA
VSAHRTPGRAALSGSARQARARRVIARDHGICYVCQRPGADQADHIIAMADGGRDIEANLAAIHADPCHEIKTRTEIARGRDRQPRKTRKRPVPRHPGLLP